MEKFHQVNKGISISFWVIILAILISISVSPEWLGSWGSLFLNAMVPMQIVISLLWRSEYPKTLASLPQPLKGFGFIGLTVAVGFFIGYLSLMSVGGGVTPPTPFVVMYLIVVVPITLWLIIPLECWPLKLFIKNEGLLGIAVILMSHLVAYGIFKYLFNFSFAVQAPFYLASLDPSGLFDAWVPLVTILITLVLILMMVLLDFWPVIALIKFLSKPIQQPLFGFLSACLIIPITIVIYHLFMNVNGMNLVVFMSRFCIPAIFGIFIILVMLEGLPTLNIPQPWRGLILISIALALSVLMYEIYAGVAIEIFKFVPSSPAYDLELWIAASMLSITFPLMVTVASYFGFWPFRKASQ
ncbi:MAG: hypothetical protein RLZZ410_901 [Pseudomonadota bacterium]|jgi:hypothetical protein